MCVSVLCCNSEAERVWFLLGARSSSTFLFLLARGVFQVQQDLRIRLPDVWPGRISFHSAVGLEKCKILIIKSHLSKVMKPIASDRNILSKDEEMSDILFLAQPLTCFVALILSNLWFYISQTNIAI